jgi:hypothetical protein
MNGWKDEDEELLSFTQAASVTPVQPELCRTGVCIVCVDETGTPPVAPELLQLAQGTGAAEALASAVQSSAAPPLARLSCQAC